ncbi:MAG: putative F420-dependent enzyme [Frankiales bacterium]|jgi:PPOX class probable F420-dependent enzyme|nr:putative F420-dependent enzyme [Frankiales bacterium]
MDLEEARAFVRDHNSNAVLSTLRKDGTPQLSPINVAVDAEGRFVISSRETAFKVKNLRRDPRAWLCVLNDAFYGRWIFLEGTVDVLSLPDAMESLVDYYRTLSGEHPDWDDYRAAMVRDQRCVIRISATRAGPDREG